MDADNDTEPDSDAELIAVMYGSLNSSWRCWGDEDAGPNLKLEHTLRECQIEEKSSHHFELQFPSLTSSCVHKYLSSMCFELH